MKAKLVYALPALILITIHLGEAQQPKKVPRIGVLLSRPASRTLDAFRQGLQELGYLEGQNIVIEYRSAKEKLDRLTDLAAELVRLKVDVIVAGGAPAIQAAKNATSTIPIVQTGVTDPVAWGFVTSLDRPGGNITGLSLGGVELFGKRLELLKETAPRASRVAVFWSPRTPTADLRFNETQAAARALGLQIQSLEVRGPNDLEGAFQAAVKGRASVLTVGLGPLLLSHRKRILDFAATKRLPGMYPLREYVEDGGLMFYGPNESDRYRRIAYYVDRILKGAKPADLPVEQPMKFEFVVNLKTAKQIGLTIPPNVLARADKVIR